MYTFKIDIGSFSNPTIGGGYIDCNPIKEKAKFVKSRHREYKRVVRNEIKGQLVFKGSEYDALKALEEQNELYVPIKCYYNSELKLTGRLDLLGTWDLNKHFCELEINTEDSYSIIFQNLDLEFDIKGASATTVKTNVYSTIITSESVCTELPANEMKDQMFGDYAHLWVTSSSYEDNCTSPAVRHVYKSSALRWPATGYELYPELNLYLKATQTSELVQDPFDRFRKVVDVLNYMLDLIDNTISANEDTISDYFTTDPEMKYLMIADKSDVKRRSSSGEAGFEYITVKDFLKIYKYLSNLDWYIENNEFKLAFPTLNPLPSFTTLPYHDFEDTSLYNNLQVYSYAIENLVNKELWSFEKSTSQDFNEQSLIYDNLYEKTTKYDFPALNCDIEEISTDSDDIGDSGYAIVACEKSGTDYLIINKPGVIFGGELMNGKLATTNIILDHHAKADRPFPTGELNDNSLTLVTKGIKKVEYKGVPIYDPELLDFVYAINTEMGRAEIESLEIDCSLARFSKVTCFILPSAIPIVDTVEITSVTSTSMIVSSEIISDNGESITERGVVYNKTGSPTIADTKVISSETNDEYDTSLTGLDQSTGYYVRAYAINSQGVGYGDEILQATQGTLATVVTNAATTIEAESFVANGEVLSDGGSSLIAQGFVYAETPTIPTLSNSKVSRIGLVGSYSLEIDGLNSSTLYNFRAYVTNDVGTSYGETKQAETLDVTTLWAVFAGTPVVTGDETTLECRVTNEVTIQVRYGVYLNGGWIYDTKTISPSRGMYNFYVQNPQGQLIPSGTPYKVETLYDSSVYTEKTGTL